MKTSELTGAALDWAVAKSEGYIYEAVRSFGSDMKPKIFPWFHVPEPLRKINQASFIPLHCLKYSDRWEQGGPIIKRKGISLLYKNHNKEWHASIDTRPDSIQGQYLFVRWHPNDPLIAAMRCVVASELGDEVEIPEELL